MHDIRAPLKEVKNWRAENSHYSPLSCPVYIQAEEVFVRFTITLLPLQLTLILLFSFLLFHCSFASILFLLTSLAGNTVL